MPHRLTSCCFTARTSCLCYLLFAANYVPVPTVLSSSRLLCYSLHASMSRRPILVFPRETLLGLLFWCLVCYFVHSQGDTGWSAIWGFRGRHWLVCYLRHWLVCYLARSCPRVREPHCLLWFHITSELDPFRRTQPTV